MPRHSGATPAASPSQPCAAAGVNLWLPEPHIILWFNTLGMDKKLDVGAKGIGLAYRYCPFAWDFERLRFRLPFQATREERVAAYNTIPGAQPLPADAEKAPSLAKKTWMPELSPVYNLPPSHAQYTRIVQQLPAPERPTVEQFFRDVRTARHSLRYRTVADWMAAVSTYSCTIGSRRYGFEGLPARLLRVSVESIQQEAAGAIDFNGRLAGNLSPAEQYLVQAAGNTSVARLLQEEQDARTAHFNPYQRLISGANRPAVVNFYQQTGHQLPAPLAFFDTTVPTLLPSPAAALPPANPIRRRRRSPPAAAREGLATVEEIDIVEDDSEDMDAVAAREEAAAAGSGYRMGGPAAPAPSPAAPSVPRRGRTPRPVKDWSRHCMLGEPYSARCYRHGVPSDPRGGGETADGLKMCSPCAATKEGKAAKAKRPGGAVPTPDVRATARARTTPGSEADSIDPR